MDHRLWRVTDFDILRQVRSLMQDKVIFIADGHHRYETALNFRDVMRKKHPGAGSLAPFEYIMMYLSNLNQGGLTILPTHRLLKHLNSWDPEALMARAEGFFEISQFEATDSGQARWQAVLEAGQEARETVIGFFSIRRPEFFYLLTTKREAVSSYLRSQGVQEVLHDLDVEVLDQVVLRHILGACDSLLGDENNIHFQHDFADALHQVRSGAYEAGFFINPTRMEQVQDVASAGLIMPHKSTYFYPKVGSGLVVNPLDPGEDITW